MFCALPRILLPGRQGNTYSSYKHHSTLKALIAVTQEVLPALYQTSMRAVSVILTFLICGILNHIEPGEMLLVCVFFLFSGGGGRESLLEYLRYLLVTCNVSAGYLKLRFKMCHGFRDFTSYSNLVVYAKYSTYTTVG